MKVQALSRKKKNGFIPTTVTITIETIEEFIALKAHSDEMLDESYEDAGIDTASAEILCNLADSIYNAAEDEQ